MVPSGWEQKIKERDPAFTSVVFVSTKMRKILISKNQPGGPRFSTEKQMRHFFQVFI